MNYSIKACLVVLEEIGDINMDSPSHQYCVSWFSIGVANVGTTLVVQAWNNHPRSCMYRVLFVMLVILMCCSSSSWNTYSRYPKYCDETKQPNYLY